MIQRYCPYCGSKMTLNCYEDTTRMHKTTADKKLCWWAKCPACQTDLYIVERKTEERR